MANPAFIAVEKKWPNDRDRLTRMSLIQEGFPQYIRYVERSDEVGHQPYTRL